MSKRRGGAPHAKNTYYCTGCAHEGFDPFWVKNTYARINTTNATTRRCYLHRNDGKVYPRRTRQEANNERHNSK